MSSLKSKIESVERDAIINALKECGWVQVWVQLKSIVVTLMWSGVVAFISLKLIDMTIGLRADEKDEEKGLDLSQHEESGYTL